MRTSRSLLRMQAYKQTVHTKKHSRTFATMPISEINHDLLPLSAYFEESKLHM